MNATPNSRPNNGINIKIGIYCKKNRIPEKLIKLQANPAKTFKSVCPAIILQKSRIAKLNGLKIYDIISTGTNKKDNAKEVPLGKNKEKNLSP